MIILSLSLSLQEKESNLRKSFLPKDLKEMWERKVSSTYSRKKSKKERTKREKKKKRRNSGKLRPREDLQFCSVSKT